MKNECDVLMCNGTWSLVSLPPKYKFINCKWVFRVKENLYGIMNKYEVKLVAIETFSPVIKSVTVRIILTLSFTSHQRVQ